MSRPMLSKELMEEAEKRGVKIKLLLLDRAFFTLECINLLDGMSTDFIMPCVCNGRIQSAVDSLGREGIIMPFSIHDNNSKKVASFTMVVYWSEKKGKLIPFATNVDWDMTRLVRMIPKEYRRRWPCHRSGR